jgi:hypothetical protein
MEEAKRVMSRIYAYATEEQVDLKVKALRAAVQEAIDITESTTFAQRLYSIFFIPVNRRALSTFHIFGILVCITIFVQSLDVVSKHSSNFAASIRLCITVLAYSNR